eukprot:3834084-Pyramimonas_sp.AAC.2
MASVAYMACFLTGFASVPAQSLRTIREHLAEISVCSNGCFVTGSPVSAPGDPGGAAIGDEIGGARFSLDLSRDAASDTDRRFGR